MRMTASWSGRYGPTEYKVVARCSAPDGKLPSDCFVVPIEITGATIEISIDRKGPIQGAETGFATATRNAGRCRSWVSRVDFGMSAVRLLIPS